MTWALAISALSLAVSLWALWMQRRMTAEMEAVWAEVDAIAAALLERH